MKTYILCTNNDGAKLFDSDELTQGAQLVIKGSEVPGELERVCGVGTVCRLVLCGEPKVVNQLCQNLSDQVRGRIVGIIPEEFSNSTLASLFDRSQQASEGKCLLVS